MTEEYKNLSLKLIDKFSEIKELYIKEKEIYGTMLDYPHVIFGDLLNPILVKLLTDDEETDRLIKMFNFIEELANSKDIEVRNVIRDTVLEYLGDNRDILNTGYKYMGKKSKELSYEVERELGRDSKKPLQ